MENKENNTQSDEFIDVYPRVRIGKSGAFRARKDNLSPAAIYGTQIGEGKKSIAINLNPSNFLKVFRKYGKSALVPVKVHDGADASLSDGKVLIKEIQTHPYKNSEVTHVDLHQIDMNSVQRFNVPLNYVGKAKGLAEGGILQIINRVVDIKCAAKDLPSSIDVDVSDLDVNASLKIDEIAEKLKDQPYEFIFESAYALVTVVPPAEVAKTAEELGREAASGAATDAAAAAAEPEKK